jgi:hypothetical protein
MQSMRPVRPRLCRWCAGHRACRTCRTSRGASRGSAIACGAPGQRQARLADPGSSACSASGQAPGRCSASLPRRDSRGSMRPLRLRHGRPADPAPAGARAHGSDCHGRLPLPITSAALCIPSDLPRTSIDTITANPLPPPALRHRGIVRSPHAAPPGVPLGLQSKQYRRGLSTTRTRTPPQRSARRLLPRAPRQVSAAVFGLLAAPRAAIPAPVATRLERLAAPLTLTRHSAYPSPRAGPEIGLTGFEPATSPTRTERATKLRHSPRGLA